MAGLYVVVVHSNLVAAILRKPRRSSDAALPTPLAIGTALAERFRTLGCIDGEYEFEDASGARLFAALCLQFIKAIAEKRLGCVEKLPSAFESYAADDSPLESLHNPGIK